MAAESFCGVLTLQVGATILSVMFFTLVGLVFAVNGFDYHNEQDGMPANLIVISVFCCLLIITGVVMFISAYNERKKLAQTAMVLSVVLLVAWLALSVLSFANKASILKCVCIRQRCPESLWLADLKYRGNWRDCDSFDDNKITAVKDIPKEPLWPYKEWEESLRPLWPYKEWDETIRQKGHREKRALRNNEVENITEPQYQIGVPLAGAIIMAITHCIFFIFTIFTMWSYFKELSCFVPVKEKPRDS